MNQKHYDTIIIGAGIIGNCIAYELSQKGYRCLSVDRLGGLGIRVHCRQLCHHPVVLLLAGRGGSGP